MIGPELERILSWMPFVSMTVHNQSNTATKTARILEILIISFALGWATVQKNKTQIENMTNDLEEQNKRLEHRIERIEDKVDYLVGIKK